MTPKAELVVDARAVLGEGAIWDAMSQRLYWVDTEGRALHLYDPSSDVDRAYSVPDRPGTVVPRSGDGVVVAMDRKVALLDQPDAVPRLLCRLAEEPVDSRLNDGKCDPAGRLWVGSMSRRPGVCALYRVDPDGSYRRVVTGVTISNGIVWSADERTMYYIDTPTRAVQAFHYDRATGEPTGRRIAFSVKEQTGSPDGMAIDSQGMLWIAFFGGAAVRRIDPSDGALLETVELPVTNVTSCAFGGNDLRDLYITTAREGLGPGALEEQSTAGGLFRARVDVPGVFPHRFAG